MRAIRLDPEPRDPPACDSYDDPAAVHRFELEVRAHRAYTEPFLVTSLEGRPDGAFRVDTAAGGSYFVDVVDGSGLRDTCTCPDFLSNELGTCKHVQAVLRAIASRPALRSPYLRLPQEPGEAVLGVRWDDGLAPFPWGRWTRSGRARVRGVLGGRASDAALDALSPGRGPDYRCVHAAVPAAKRLREAVTHAARRAAVDHAIEAGELDPNVLRRPLFPYQRAGALHLLRAGRALLADDMGLGKTIQALAACELLRRRGEASRVLVVTAASIKHQWAQEIERYAGERAAVVGGGAAERRRALEAGATYTVMNYELTWRELSTLQRLPGDVLILDEAQRAKNFRTKTAATLRAIPSRFLFILTGTPIENRLDDLYSLLQLVDPRVLGPLWRFNLDFHVQNERGRIKGYKHLSALRARVAPLVLRRRKEEVLHDLPPVLEQTRYTPLSREQEELEAGYRQSAASLIAIAEKRPLRKEEQERLMMLLLKARQACNALELCDPGRKRKGSPKLDEFEALVAEIASEDSGKILVFSEWVEMLKLAGARLKALEVGYEMLHGGVPTERRPALLQRFRDDPKIRVLLSTDAGGVGLNLQAASYVVHLDLPWNPARLDQRTARAHRLGQTRGVMVTYLCSETGIERGIEGTLSQKRAVRAAALDASSTEEELEAPSFSVFLRQMRDVFRAMDGAMERDGLAQDDVRSAAPALPDALADATSPASGSAAPGIQEETAAVNRLRLARLVLDAGFATDALRAAYEALAAAIAAVGGAPRPDGHAALVALVYRDLLPSGRLPAEAHAVLARLHDLTTLERSGVTVDRALAAAAVGEAEGWVARLSLEPRA